MAERSLAAPAPRGPVVDDAFGLVALACLEARGAPGQVAEIIERDDGYISVGDAGRYFNPPDPAELDWVVDRARGAVLDIGAGMGRFSVPLQERGLDVTALDISAGALEVCRRRGVRSTYLGSVDSLAESGHGRFDTLLLLGNGLGLLESEQRAPDFLKALEMLAAYDASLLAEGNDARQPDHPEHLAYHEHNRRTGRMPGQVRIRVRHKAFASAWFAWLHLSLQELTSIVSRTGWQIVETSEPDSRDSGRYRVRLRRRA